MSYNGHVFPVAPPYVLHPHSHPQPHPQPQPQPHPHPQPLQMVPPGPPYPPTVALLGGVPLKSLDIPIASVFLALFIGGAIGHMAIFQVNMRRGHKFIMSGMTFGFCMARIVTMIMRIVWACYPTNVRIAIAAGIFVAVGVVLLFLINIIFAVRIVRATHPKFGWGAPFSWFFKVIYVLIPISIIMIITVTVQSYYTLDPNTHRIDRDIQLAVESYFLFLSFLPLPVVCIALAIPRSKDRPLEKFGTGHWCTKITILLCSTAILCLGAAFRTGTNFLPPKPVETPPSYYSKACFWIFNTTVEIIIVYAYILVRVDTRFWVPNGSRSAGGFAAALEAQKQGADPDPSDSSSDEKSVFERAGNSVGSEEELFDLQTGNQEAKDDEKKADEEKAENSKGKQPAWS